MLAGQSFFENTFFVNGAEGTVLLALCIAAVVCTLAVLALAIAVIVVLKRRNRENLSEISEGELAPNETPFTPALNEARAEDVREIERTPYECGEKVQEAEQTPVEEAAEVLEEEPVEESKEEAAQVEELSESEMEDVQSYKEEQEDENGIEVVGVMFRRRGRKVYWFDPDGKSWEKGEIAFYLSNENPPQEVIVVDVAKRSKEALHLPLKPLCKAAHRQAKK